MSTIKLFLMYCIIWLREEVWQIFTNEVWHTRKEAEEYAIRNKFKKSVIWKVIWYDKKYHV